MTRKWVRLFFGVAVVLLASGSSPAGTVVFSDDFESGNLDQWTAFASPAGPLTISIAQNQIPVGGMYSAQIASSVDRMYHNLGSEVSGHILFTSYLYDDTQSRAFTEIRAYSGAGFNDGALQQLLAIGKYSSVTMPDEVYDGTKYQGRVLYPSATMGWFNLNAPGAPSRATGWHRLDIEVMPSGTDVNFYVDGILGRAITGAIAATYDSVVMGSVGAGSTVADAWIDGIQVEVTAPAVPGDANNDGKVDDLDASALAANWLTTGGATLAQGDFNADGNVDDLDASILAANWPSASGAAVPEPATLALLLSALLTLAIRRRR